MSETTKFTDLVLHLEEVSSTAAKDMEAVALKLSRGILYVGMEGKELPEEQQRVLAALMETILPRLQAAFVKALNIAETEFEEAGK